MASSLSTFPIWQAAALTPLATSLLDHALSADMGAAGGTGAPLLRPTFLVWTWRPAEHLPRMAGAPLLLLGRCELVGAFGSFIVRPARTEPALSWPRARSLPSRRRTPRASLQATSLPAALPAALGSIAPALQASRRYAPAHPHDASMRRRARCNVFRRVCRARTGCQRRRRWGRRCSCRGGPKLRSAARRRRDTCDAAAEAEAAADDDDDGVLLLQPLPSSPQLLEGLIGCLRAPTPALTIELRGPPI